MKKLIVVVILLVVMVVPVWSQELSPAEQNYQRALAKIEEARVSGATELDLSGNSSFYNLEQLPPEIRNLTNLQYLSLSNTQLTSLPPEIGNLTNLQVLDLPANITFPPPDITSQGTFATLQYLRDYPALQLRNIGLAIAGVVGLVVMFGLGLRWRMRGSDKKKKAAVA
jgi:hypothetical protein